MIFWKNKWNFGKNEILEKKVKFWKKIIFWKNNQISEK